MSKILISPTSVDMYNSQGPTVNLQFLSLKRYEEICFNLYLLLNGLFPARQVAMDHYVFCLKCTCTPKNSFDSLKVNCTNIQRKRVHQVMK